MLFYYCVEFQGKSGKTTISNILISQLQEIGIVNYRMISFDEIGSNIAWNETSFHTIRERGLSELRQELSMPDNQEKNSQRVIIVDDIMHLRSMRREVYQLARDYSSPLICVWVHTPIELAWNRNDRRRIDDPKGYIERTAFMKISDSFQPPDASHICDRNYLIIDNSSDSQCSEGIKSTVALIHSVFDNFDNFVVKIEDAREVHTTNLISSPSFLKECDEYLRKLVAKIIQASRLASSPLLTTKEVASVISAVKEITFQDIKSRLTQIEWNTSLSSFISELFQQHLLQVCQHKGYTIDVVEFMSSLLVDVDIPLVK